MANEIHRVDRTPHDGGLIDYLLDAVAYSQVHCGLNNVYVEIDALIFNQIAKRHCLDVFGKPESSKMKM